MPGLCYSEQVRRQMACMDQMLERLNVDRAFAAGLDGGLAWREARTKCIFCSHVRRCSEWLGAPEPLQSPRAFCPNVEFFQGCFSEIVRHHGIVP